MPSSSRLFIALGSISAMFAVLFGAFGTHGLDDIINADLMAIYKTGVEYHFYHALGLILTGLLVKHYPTSSLLKWSGWIMFSGIIIFSGSLYVLALTGIRWLGAITPIGGMAFIFAWLGISISVYKE
jgi:uncharacterized membrane protein YgdD (TMEM256/DUF423 family)